MYVPRQRYVRCADVAWWEQDMYHQLLYAIEDVKEREDVMDELEM